MRSMIHVWLALACLSFTTAVAIADTTPPTRAQTSHTGPMPARGLSMRQVEKKFGKPLKVLPPTGPTSKYKPPITRWVYDDFIVYFERDLVIHSARPRDPEKFRRLKEIAPTSDSAP
ncbi:MAG: hypothetical protein ACE5ET_06435 [Gammaproteobacteria bacterium]